MVGLEFHEYKDIELLYRFMRHKNKKGGIAPLQPIVLAAFRPWGVEQGAGRTATAKIGNKCLFLLHFF